MMRDGYLREPTEDALAQVCRPVVERTSELGCWIIAAEPVEQDSQKSQAFWHFNSLSDIGSGEACKDAIEYGCGGIRKNVAVDHCGARAGGQRVRGAQLEIGPLPVIAGETYAVRCLEAVFAPGMTAPSHTHAGPEAWYALSGETCLETPDGQQIGRAGGEPVIIPGGATHASHGDRH